MLTLTSGEWEYDGDDNVFVEEHFKDTISGRCMSLRGIVATLPDYHDPQEKRSNGVLFANAKRLYEAVKRVVDLDRDAQSMPLEEYIKEESESFASLESVVSDIHRQAAQYRTEPAPEVAAGPESCGDGHPVDWRL